MANNNDIKAGDNSSEDDRELLLKVVEDYYFTNENQEPVSLTDLPYDMNGDENTDGLKQRIFLQGTADGGLQKVYKQAIAWKLNLEEQTPVVCVMIKEKAWIQLQKPRKSYEEIIWSFLVAAHFLHFARKSPEAPEKAYWDHLRKIFSTSDDTPTETHLLEHSSLIEGTCQKDKKLKKSDVLKTFLEMKSKRKPFDEDGDINPKGKRAKFVISDEESDEDSGGNGLDESDEEDDLFDSVCAICDNGGELLCCEGPCMRSFHPNREAGEDSSCRSLGLSKAQIRDIQNYYCPNCKYKQHQCFSCGKLGSSDKSLKAEAFCCVSATCGRFYHPSCVSKLIASGVEAEELEKKIADGLQFTCPVHRCCVCKKTEQKEDEDMQFAICRRCPVAYHRKCLPKSIIFEETDDELQRAWDDLIPNRILIYCRKHKIDPELLTPRRNHITFPEAPSAYKTFKLIHVISPESGVGKTVGKKMKSLDSAKEKFSIKSTKEKFSPQFIKEKVSPKASVKKENSKLSGRGTALLKVCSTYGLPKKVNKETEMPSLVRKEDKQSMLEIKKTLVQKESKPKYLELNKRETVNKTSFTEAQKKSTIILPTFTANDIKIIVMDIVERSTAGISLSDVCAKHQVPSTYRRYSGNLDKSITQGKVEGAVEAVRTALKKLEEGGNLDDAKAVCGPDILNQMRKWKNKLNVYLSPFLHGNRYTSYGRHFTQVSKLKEVVERLHWYVQDGDMIVDFCCGANDFSNLMKDKLEQSGKKCFYKNFDIFQAKDDFEFERRDWMSVGRDELVAGTRLIMGLNPPFGNKANELVDKALEFRPKLLILIVPRETIRLDKKRERYDLVWEDLDLLKGKSFYMPGSVDVDDNPLEQWNKVPPPLYLWSRPDWTVRHRAIAIKQGHAKDHMMTTKPEVPDTKLSQAVEGNLGSGKQAEKDQQGSAFGTETINYRENERESKPDSVFLVYQLDGSRQKDALLTKIKDEQKESKYERCIPDKKNHEDNLWNNWIYESKTKDMDSDMYDHGHLGLFLEQNYTSIQERGGYEDEDGCQEHQKEKSPVRERERVDHIERKRHQKGRYEKGKHEVDISEKGRPKSEMHGKDRKRERPDKGKFKNERNASSPPSKKLDIRKDGENEYNGYMQEQGSLHLSATDHFGRAFDGGPGHRENHDRGLQVGANQLGQESGRGFQGILHGSVDRGYGRMSGSEDDGFGSVNRGGSKDYGFSCYGNVDEEYDPAEVNKGFSSSSPALEFEYSVSPKLQIMQNNIVHNRQVQCDNDSERSKLLQDTRAPDWLMGSSQRRRYHFDQTSCVSDAYVPELHHSLMLGQQHEEPSHLSRGMCQSEIYGLSELTSSAIQHNAPRLDQNMNYTSSTLPQIDQIPRNSYRGAGKAHGSESFPFNPPAFAPGPQDPYPHLSSAGWIDE